MKKITRQRKVDGIVYCFTNLKNGHQYVGTTINKLKTRLNTHYSLISSGAPLLVKALKKYGEKGFKVSSIDTAKTIGELHDKERFWIKELNTKAPNGYNMTDGGFTNEAAMEANKIPVKCLSNGKIYPSGTEAAYDTKVPSYLIGFNCRGRQDSAGGLFFEFVDSKKRKEAEKERQKRKDRQNPINKEVKNLETGEVYSSINEAARKIGISRNMISLICSGKILNLKGVPLAYLDKELRKKTEERVSKKLKVRNARIDRNSVICITTKEEFPSVSAAARKFNLSHTTVMKQIRGGEIRSSLKFKFKKGEAK